MKTIKVEVAYATRESQDVIAVVLPLGGTVEDAIHASGLLNTYPTIDLAQPSIGIFGQKVTLDTVLSSGDRVEIYRPLSMDPKEARRLKRKAKKTASVDV